MSSRPPSPGGGGSAAKPAGWGDPSDKLTRFRRATARGLRERTTSAERRLWAAIVRVPLAGTHFRRQVPIGPYVVDFACLATRLVVELDGASHSHDGAVPRDGDRQAWLEQEGFRVVRFWNEEVYRNVEGVLDTIYAAVHESLSAESRRIKHQRRRRSYVAHPTPDLQSDPPPSGEGDTRLE